MSVLGYIKIQEFLEKTNGSVRGKLITDAKDRAYFADYKWVTSQDGHLIVSRRDGAGDEVKIGPIMEIDESILAFWGLYCGDGAKGSEDPHDPRIVKPVVSFSQREPNLVRFASESFRKHFPGDIRFVYSLGEDSAFFMEGKGLEILRKYYRGRVPPTPPLSNVRSQLDAADEKYLSERRPVLGTNEEHLAFYYFHKEAMQEILTSVKLNDLKRSGITLHKYDRVTASLRRPFKKGAREPGGSSRSDEMHVGGLNGFGELFLKILYEIEDTIYCDTQLSTQGLIEWRGKPSDLGETIDVKQFFNSHSYGMLAGERPSIWEEANLMYGKWPRSKDVQLHKSINIDPLFCYVAGLYLAEGTTSKSLMFSMFSKPVSGLNLGFTSSEGVSLDLLFRSLQKLFRLEDCIDAWKIKVGSQYFPELVVIGLKNGVPMLRGGVSGDGKLRTMEISLALKEWALEVAPTLVPFQHKYSHVEPTGAGLARIDFWASSSLCKWYFPLLMYAAFGNYAKDPVGAFICD